MASLIAHRLPYRQLLLLGLAAFVLASVGCQSAPSITAYRRLDDRASTTTDPTDVPHLTQETFRQLTRELRPGDVVIGGKNAPSAAMIRLSMDAYGFYTHSGIIDVRDGRVVVSHVTGRFQLLHDSQRLLGKLVGEVEAIDLEDFIAEYDEIKFVRLPDARNNARLPRLVRACEDAGIAFDPFFDFADPTSVHCSEYTLRVLQHAGYDLDFTIVGRTPNRSLSEFLAKLGVVTEQFVRVDGFAELPGTRTLAIVSRFPNRNVSLAVADALGVLHGVTRADPDLPIRDVISCDADRLLHYAPATETFLRAVVGMSLAEPTRDAAEIRRRNDMIFDVVGAPRIDWLVSETTIPLDLGGR